MNKKTVTSILVIAWLLVIAGLISCSSSPKTQRSEPETIGDLEVVTVQETQVADTFEAMGTVRARQTAQLASQTTGTITAIHVHEGDRVRQGQTLAVIDDAQARAGVVQTQAALSAANDEVNASQSDLALASSTLERYRLLYEKKSLSPQEFDEVNARFKAASSRRDEAHSRQEQMAAALKQSQINVDHMRVRTPFAGVVTARQADPGTLATPGMTLLTVEDTARYRLETSVNERDLQYVHLAQNVSVSVDALGNDLLEGKVVQIVPAADPESRSFIVKVELPARAGLRSGLFGRARFSRGERTSLTVPQSAIVERGQLREIYVVGDDKIASLRYVSVGNQRQGRVEVLSGLRNGETLVADPGQRELGGKRIEVR